MGDGREGVRRSHLLEVLNSTGVDGFHERCAIHQPSELLEPREPDELVPTLGRLAAPTPTPTPGRRRARRRATAATAAERHAARLLLLVCGAAHDGLSRGRRRRGGGRCRSEQRSAPLQQCERLLTSGRRLGRGEGGEQDALAWGGRGLGGYSSMHSRGAPPGGSGPRVCVLANANRPVPQRRADIAYEFRW